MSSFGNMKVLRKERSWEDGMPAMERGAVAYAMLFGGRFAPAGSLVERCQTPLLLRHSRFPNFACSTFSKPAVGATYPTNGVILEPFGLAETGRRGISKAEELREQTHIHGSGADNAAEYHTTVRPRPTSKAVVARQPNSS